MCEIKDPYYSRPEVSNSDLSWLKKYWLQEDVIVDLEKAYRFGTLIDCMITEPFKVNYFNLTCAGVQYTKEDFLLAEEMKKAFWRDEFCATLARHSEYQKVTVRHNFPIEYDGFFFTIDMRCKWDLYAMPKLLMSGDIKSTACTTQKQFEEAVRYFDYDRQRAVYMDLEGVSNDMLIGISKVNQKIFKVPVKRGGDLYNSGKQKYQELAFKYWYLFEDVQCLQRA
jgi:hypothetical protein